jgi:tRNA(fMet)-specific endonuclease VapC
MPLYLLDTSTFSHLMNRHTNVLARAQSLSANEHIAICTVVRGEIHYGLERMPQGRRRQALEITSINLFAMIPCEPIPEAAGDIYGRIKRETEGCGTPIGENDLWIAATALALGAVLVTADSDFQSVPGLMLDDWTQ